MFSLARPPYIPGTDKCAARPARPGAARLPSIVGYFYCAPRRARLHHGAATEHATEASSPCSHRRTVASPALFRPIGLTTITFMPVAPPTGRGKLPPYGWTSKNYVIFVCFHCHGTSSYHTTNTLQGRRAKNYVDTQTIQPGLGDFVL